MSNRTLLILGAVALVILTWAVIQSGLSSSPTSPPDTLTYLIQGLEPDSIDSIIVSGKDSNDVTLRRRGSGFVSVDKDDYPADTKQINDLISKCAEIQIQTSKPYTSNPDNHKTLEVTEEGARDLVKFLKADSSLLAGVAVGKSREAGEGTYVRLLPGDNVYVTLKSPWIRKRAVDYINQEITSVKRDDIEFVMVVSPDGEYTLKPQKDGDGVLLDNVPPGKKLKSNDARSVLGALTSLRFDDVKKDPGDLNFDMQYVCRLKDSTIYTLKLAKADNKTYASCAAEFTDPTPVEKTPVAQGGKVESEEELKAKEAKLLARENAGKFAARHNGWVYEIADWKAKNLTKKLSDLLEDDKKPQEPNDVKPEEPNAPKKIEEPDTSEPDVPAVTEPNGPRIDEPNTTEADDPNRASTGS